jgi:hypothetical protein
VAAALHVGQQQRQRRVADRGAQHRLDRLRLGGSLPDLLDEALNPLDDHRPVAVEHASHRRVDPPVHGQQRQRDQEHRPGQPHGRVTAEQMPRPDRQARQRRGGDRGGQHPRHRVAEDPLDLEQVMTQHRDGHRGRHQHHDAHQKRDEGAPTGPAERVEQPAAHHQHDDAAGGQDEPLQLLPRPLTATPVPHHDAADAGEHDREQHPQRGEDHR